MSLEDAEARDIESLQNWLNGTGCIAREETAYLAQSREVATLAPSRDRALLRMEVWMESALIRFYRGFRNVRNIETMSEYANKDDQDSRFNLSVDPNVFPYSGPLIKRAARAILLSLITSLLLMPVAICNLTQKTSSRIVVVMISTIIYLVVLSELTKSRTMELVLAGVT